MYSVLGIAIEGPAPTATVPIPAVPTPVQQADASCAKCHQAIDKSYLRTHKANASGIASDNFIPGTYTQPSSGATYRFESNQGMPWLIYSLPDNSSLSGERPLSYFLGSGYLGITYLYSVNGYLMESPAAWYRATNRYDMKPGLDELREVAPAIPVEPACLRCHMSGVRPVDAGTLNHYTGLPFEHGGITCESCHGDAEQHVKSGGKSPITNPARLEPQLRDSVCISCHLEGDVAVEKNGHSSLDYKPGEDIAAYLSFFVYANADPNARGVSEVEQFASSHCKRTSGEKMSCTSCHDPHYTPAAEDRVSFYRGKCLACHAGADFAAAHHPENPDCASCHMPRAGAQNIPHVAWTDHRILARPPAAPAAAPQFTTMLPIFSPSASPRDHALALYASVNDGHTENGAQALAQLSAAYQNDRNDVQVVSALGTLTNMKGDTQQAEALFASALSLDPTNRIAAVNLAILKARAGDLDQARKLLQPVFERNQDLPIVAMDLAAIACKQGDATAAQSALQAALRYDPGSEALRTRLAEAASCQQSTPQQSAPQQSAPALHPK